MRIELAKGLVVKVSPSSDDGDPTGRIMGRLFQAVPISTFRFKFPGGVRPDFSSERKAGLTVGEVFGEFTLEAVLDKAAEKILAGQYRINLKASKSVGLTAFGTPALGEMALTAFLRACQESNDEQIRAWVTAVLENAQDHETGSQ